MIWPSASVIMMKPMPVARSASAANTAVQPRLTTSAPMIAAVMAKPHREQIGGGIGGDAEQAGVTERDEAAVADQDVQAEREDGVEQDLARHVDVIDARHPIGQGDQRDEGHGEGDVRARRDAAHGTCLPNRPCGRKISTSSIGRNSTK